MGNRIKTFVSDYIIFYKQQLIGIFLCLFIVCGCEIPRYKNYKTNKFMLRQLVKETNVEKESFTSFFLVGSTHSESSEYRTTVKVFAKVGYTYRFIEMDIENIRIILNNNIKTPYIRIKYRSKLKFSDNKLIDYEDWYLHKTYLIYCPEKYLPEKLLPIEL